MKEIIQVDNIVHRYGAKLALNGISFNVNEGEVFGLLGPNGVGKTTTIRLLNGLLIPSSGKMTVLGFDPQKQGVEIRSRVGVLTETPALYERLTALENLQFFGSLAGMTPSACKDRVRELLEFFNLTERTNDRVGSYSKGMKQRLALARALLIKPDLLFLDEPTTGLDPEVAKQVHDLIMDVRLKDGHTVVLCTHHLYEAERLCDRMAVMGKGKLIAMGTLDQLRAEAAPEHKTLFSFLSPISTDALSALKKFAGVEKIEEKGPCGLLIQIKNKEITPELINLLVKKGSSIIAVEPQQASLEEIYFRLQQRAEENIQ
jgi:ABC-2 type transport system ATP-binding protein